MSSKHLTEMGIDSGDEPVCNHSGNPHFATIVEQRISRRQMLTGSLGAAVAGMFGVASFAPAHASNPAWLPPSAHDHPPFALNPALSFSAIPPTRPATTLAPSRSNRSACDGMHFFPFPHEPNPMGRVVEIDPLDPRGVPKIKRAPYDPAQADRIYAVVRREIEAMRASSRAVSNSGNPITPE